MALNATASPEIDCAKTEVRNYSTVEYFRLINARMEIYVIIFPSGVPRIIKDWLYFSAVLPINSKTRPVCQNPMKSHPLPRQCTRIRPAGYVWPRAKAASTDKSDKLVVHPGQAN